MIHFHSKCSRTNGARPSETAGQTNKKLQRKIVYSSSITYQAVVVGQHDNNLSVMVPNHSPEVCGGMRQRMLGNDELIAPVVALK